jgi:putative ABC transport system ATP-binding protein
MTVHQPPAVQPPPSLPLLRVAGLWKHYGPQAVIRGMHLEVAAGERVALMGPSGSGKSTLLNIISGLEPADSGTVHLATTDLTQLNETAWARLRRQSIATVFQFFHLLPTLSAAENVEFALQLLGTPATERRRRVAAVLDEVAMAHKAAAYPATLSGGEMQRVAIARALVVEPQLLLADEPTGSLDSATGASILSLLATLTSRHGTSLLMATHSAEAAAACHRVLQVRDGQLVTNP